MTDYSAAVTIAVQELLKAVESPPPIPLPASGPVVWQDVIDAMEAKDCAEFLKYVLRTRRRAVTVGLNGRLFTVQRAEMRDYLRQRGLPRWLRNRPIPANLSGTVQFRRYTPFKGAA